MIKKIIFIFCLTLFAHIGIAEKQKIKPNALNKTLPWFWVDAHSNTLVFNLYTKDIDISKNGVQWYHLFGDTCISKLTRLDFQIQ